jgi:hypothetical protein
MGMWDDEVWAESDAREEARRWRLPPATPGFATVEVTVCEICHTAPVAPAPVSAPLRQRSCAACITQARINPAALTAWYNLRPHIAARH